MKADLVGVGEGLTMPSWPARAAMALLGCGSVVALLAWVSGLGSFAWWFLATGATSITVLTAIDVYSARHPSSRWLRETLVAGSLGGLIGSFGYDLFRVPFVLGGLRVLAPVDSYGVLVTGAGSSSALTGIAGWAYHYSNGIGFGIAYALIARGRRWWWGVVWALVLESATVVSPFAAVYSLQGKWLQIGIAYAAHIPFGVAIGVAAERAARLTEVAEQATRRPLLVSFGVVALVLFVWQRPYSVEHRKSPGSFAEGPSATIDGWVLEPAWVRIDPDECLIVRNVSDRLVSLSVGGSITPGDESELCFDNPGPAVKRIRVRDANGYERAFSGGWVIVDPER